MLKSKSFWIVVAFAIFTTIPFLGLTEFNTKGEPRESIVAVSMLQNGDWILPTNNGGEFAYKPPFFHWCIAATSLIPGEVTLFTSRFPSAIAAIAMLIACYIFFAKRKDETTALLASLICFTFFEVHRAIFACRVDMVLTGLIVLALLQLYKWNEKGMRGVPIIATLLMGCATLTKGPVGIILPCLTMGVFSLMRGENFWKCVWKYGLAAIISAILPALWYVAAYQRGGESFLDLVMEENFGRFMGKMSYESHENPPHYYLVSLIAGCLPWTLMLLVSLFFLKYKKPTKTLKEYWTKIKGMNPYNLFALLVIVIIVAFYCIPKSKRSVYILPIYPFLAYYIAIYAQWLLKNFPKAIKIFGWIVSSLGFLLLLAFTATKYGWIPDSVCGTGKHAIDNLLMLRALESIPISIITILFITLPAYAIWQFVRYNSEEKLSNKVLYSICAVAISIFLSLDAIYQPAILTSKSDKVIADEVSKIANGEPITSYVATYMLHFFGINWYLDDNVGVFDPDKYPNKDTKGYMLVGEKDYTKLQELYGDRYTFEEVYRSNKRSCDVKQIVLLLKYSIN